MSQQIIFTPEFNIKFVEKLKNSQVLKDKMARAEQSYLKNKESVDAFVKTRK